MASQLGNDHVPALLCPHPKVPKGDFVDWLRDAASRVGLARVSSSLILRVWWKIRDSNATWKPGLAVG